MLAPGARDGVELLERAFELGRSAPGGLEIVHENLLTDSGPDPRNMSRGDVPLEAEDSLPGVDEHPPDPLVAREVDRGRRIDLTLPFRPGHAESSEVDRKLQLGTLGDGV